MKIAEFLASVGFQADEKSMSTALAKVAGFGAAISVAAGVAIAGITRIAESQVAIAKNAEKLGTSIEKLEEMGYVAQQTGSSMDAVNSSLAALKGKYPHIKDASKLLEEAGRRMEGMSEAGKKLYASRMGIDPSLIPMLTRDVSALKDEWKAMYAVAGTDAAKAAEDSKAFLAEMGKLKTIAEMLSKAVGFAFLGEIRRDIESLRRIIMDNFAKIKRIFESVISIVLRVAGVIGALISRAVKWASSLVAWYDKLDDGQKRMVMGIGAMLAAWKLLNAGFLATPLGVIVAGLAGIVALVDDYLTYMEGGESYFDWGPYAESIEDVRQALGTAVDAVMAFLQENAGFFTALATGIGITLGLKAALLAVTGVLGGVAGAVKLLFGLIRANPLGAFITSALLIIEYWEPIKAFFAGLWDGVAEKFPDFAAWAENAAKSILDFFAPALDWIKEKFQSLMDILPDFVKKKLGIDVTAKKDQDKTKVESKPETKPAPAAKSKPEPKPEPATKPRIAPAVDPAPAPEPKPELKPEPKPEPKQAPATEPRIAPTVDPAATPEPKPELKPVPEPEPKQAPAIEPRIVPAVDPAATPEPKPELKPVPEPEPKQAPAIEPRIVPTVDSEPKVKPDPKPEPKPEPEPQKPLPPEPVLVRVEQPKAAPRPWPLPVPQVVAPPTGPMLTPSPARGAELEKVKEQHIKLESKTEINVHGADSPQAVGQRVLEGQGSVNADLVRHTKGAVR